MWENEFTSNEMEVVTTVFKQYETGLREGRINAEDLHTALVACGLNPMEQEVIDMTNEVARDGVIFFPEFCKVILRKFREDNVEVFGPYMFKTMCGSERYENFAKTPIQPYERAKKWKKEKNSLSKTEFTHIMKNLPVPVSETEIEEMFDVADTDRDGIIGYPEFMTMLNPPKISEKPPRESRTLPIEQKRSPTKLEEKEVAADHFIVDLLEEKVATKVTIENEKESKVELMKQDSLVNLVSNAV